MFKKLLLTFASLVLFAFLARDSFAATSVRLEQPATPTNQNTFNLTFVALDTDNNPVTVTCWKQAPGDAGFSQFGSSIALSNGGNSDNCPVDSTIVTSPGTYAFYVVANSTTSNTVTVAYDNATPGNPTNYSKTQNNSCQYTISYTTANDGGQTVKVELYRSSSSNFSVDSGSRVDTHTIGSNTNDSFTNSVPDCSKQWYFAIRAFSSDGNASGAVGDSQTVTNTTVITPTGTQQTGGAIVVANSQVTRPTGEENGAAVAGTTPSPTEGTRNVLGAQTKSTPTPTPTGLLATLFTSKKMLVLDGIVLVLLLGVGWYLYTRFFRK